MGTNEIKVSDVKSLISSAHATLCVVLHALDTKILIGEINRPEGPVEKIPRKRRTKREIEAGKKAPDGTGKGGPEPQNLPDADKGNPFYGEKKREKKGVEES